MIEKLEKHIIGENAPGTVSLMVAPTTEQQVDKINELVDVVNALIEENNIHEKQIDELQMKLKSHKCESRPENVQPDAESRPENVQPDAESRPENVQDKFAEQRRWIGKLCRFWDYDGEGKCFNILKEIGNPNTIQVRQNGAFRTSNGYWYKHCEPVKPTDSIIYKGNDNV